MSKKRKPVDLSTAEEQTGEGSDSFQQDGNVKRAKLSLLSDTTLHDLPLELMECILIKAIVMEVKDTKLASCVWKEKADAVMDRLRTVCSRWSDIMATNFFRKELHRTLDAQETIRLEVLLRSVFQTYVYRIATLKDEIFMLCYSLLQAHPSILVYDRNNVAVEKDAIPLPKTSPLRMVACCVSNCLYVLSKTKKYNHCSLLRIARDVDENRFTMSRLIGDVYLPHSDLCVSANGSLILSRQQTMTIDAISVHDASGVFQQTVRLPSDVSSGIYCIVPKCNGNLVLIQADHQHRRTKLKEIDMSGVIVRRYQSALLYGYARVCQADNDGRLLVSDSANNTELLDSEFNLMEFSSSPLGVAPFHSPNELHYNSDRNEIVTFAQDLHSLSGLLTVCRLT